MTLPAANVLPSIRTLPLADDAQELFSRAVRIVQQRPTEFAHVAGWINEHYSERAMRTVCERRYRHRFAYRLSLLRRHAATYNRRLAIRQGRPLQDLMRERIEEARLRGQRLKGTRLVTRSYPTAHPDEKAVDETNVYSVWRGEDEQYRRQCREIKAERKAAKLAEAEHPEKPSWRLAQAVGEITDAEYPDGYEHVEHSRRIVAIAALLMPEPLPVLGELGQWPFSSRLYLPEQATGHWLTDAVVADAAAAAKSPHGYRPTLLDLREFGREEVLFVRMPGEPRKVAQRFPLNDLLNVLRVAVDELESKVKVELCVSTASAPFPDKPSATEIASSGVTWQTAMKRAQNHCAHNPFPGINALARIVGCSSSTVSKAVHRSPRLRAKLAEHIAKRKSMSGRTMSEGVAASAVQTRERDPSDTASMSTDDVFQALLQQEKPARRAKMNAMSPAQRLELVATVEHDPDKALTVRGLKR